MKTFAAMRCVVFVCEFVLAIFFEGTKRMMEWDYRIESYLIAIHSILEEVKL